MRSARMTFHWNQPDLSDNRWHGWESFEINQKQLLPKKIVQHSKFKSNWLPVEPSEHRWASTPATHKSYLFNDSGSWSTLELEHIFKRGSWNTPSRPASLPGPRQRGGTVRKGRSRFQTNLAKPGWLTRLLLLPRTLLLLYQRVSPANFTCNLKQKGDSYCSISCLHFYDKKKAKRTFIQFDVAATRKLKWLWRLDTGSLNGLIFLINKIVKTFLVVFFVASSLFSLLSKIMRPYNGVCPLSVVFNQTDLRVYLKSFINWYILFQQCTSQQGHQYAQRLKSLVREPMKMLKIDCVDMICS